MHRKTRTILALLQLEVSVALAPLALFLSIPSIIVVLPLMLWLWVLSVRVLLNKEWQLPARLLVYLQLTHWSLVVLEALLIVYGIYALKGAHASAAAGGGLLGAFGLFPIGIGLLSGIGSITTIVVLRNAVRDRLSPAD